MRWTRFAKFEVWTKCEAQLKATCGLNNFTSWRLHMVRNYYIIILKSHKIEDARKIIEESYKNDSRAIQVVIQTQKNSTNAEPNTSSIDDTSQAAPLDHVQVLDLACAITKGVKGKKSIPGIFDHVNKGKRRKHREFGS